MRNARCWVAFAVILLAASLLPGCGRGGKEAKPLQVALGMSTADVEAKLGKPQETASTPDGPTVWTYEENDTRVEVSFEDGRVTRIVHAVVGDDAKEIEGTWKVVSGVYDGEEESERTPTMFAIGGDKITPLDGRHAGESAQYRLDLSASPKGIDVVDPKGRRTLGIFSLAGDDLKICFADGGVARPTKYESQTFSRTVLFVLKRQSREWSHAVASKPKLKAPPKPEVPEEKRPGLVKSPPKPDAKGPGLVKVSGTVKFKDGTTIPVPEGGRATITFAPADTREITEGQIRKGASARIRPDGTFEMMTIRPGDGVIPGRYRVFLMTQKNVAANPNDPANQFVPKKYTSAVTSGLEVTIDKPTSDLRFELDKQ